MSKIVTKRFHRAHLSAPYLRPSRNDNNNVLRNESLELQSQELLNNILEQLHTDRPSERTFGTDMIISYITNELISSEKFDKNNEFRKILQQLRTMICDRSENVRFGTIDALCHLSTLNESIIKQMAEQDIQIHQEILNFFQQFLLPLNVDQMSGKNRKVSSLTIFIDAFNLLISICDHVPDTIDSVINFVGWKQILLKCINIHSSNDLDRMNLTIAAIQLLSLIIDERRGNRFIQRFELNDSFNELNNRLESMNSTETSVDVPSTSTGNFYLQCLLLQMSCSDLNPTSAPNESIFVQLGQLIRRIFNANFNENFKKFIEQIEDDLSNEMQKLQQMYPLYQELRLYLCCKQFCFEWLTNMTGLSFDNEDANEDEMMEDDNVETTELDPSLQQFIQEQSILSIISNELSNIPFRIDTDHLYGKEIINLMDNYLMTSLTLLHNLIGHHSCLSFTMNEIDKIWNIVFLIAFDDDKMDEDNVRTETQISFDVRKEAINVIRQFVQKFSDNSNKLTMDIINQLKTLWSHNDNDYDLRINIVKIISDYLQKSSTIITERSSMIIEWIRFILNTLTMNSNHSSLIFAAEILDSIIDILSDESIASECIRNDSSLYSLLTNKWQQFQRLTRSKSIQKQNPCIAIVHENMQSFLDYLRNFL
ncbi:uncharacterized protein LOC113789066 [Dermatophagoides pteronyssinus]|uniref:uncharacterized protein LOC113789066 n=1 Tax=Dermatophagoides pteronyssinus TaxID=6956 RepID=UPI003F66AC73